MALIFLSGPDTAITRGREQAGRSRRQIRSGLTTALGQSLRVAKSWGKLYSARVRLSVMRRRRNPLRAEARKGGLHLRHGLRPARNVGAALTIWGAPALGAPILLRPRPLRHSSEGGNKGYQVQSHSRGTAHRQEDLARHRLLRVPWPGHAGDHWRRSAGRAPKGRQPQMRPAGAPTTS